MCILKTPLARSFHANQHWPPTDTTDMGFVDELTIYVFLIINLTIQFCFVAQSVQLRDLCAAPTPTHCPPPPVRGAFAKRELVWWSCRGGQYVCVHMCVYVCESARMLAVK